MRKQALTSLVALSGAGVVVSSSGVGGCGVVVVHVLLNGVGVGGCKGKGRVAGYQGTSAGLRAQV